MNSKKIGSGAVFATAPLAGARPAVEQNGEASAAERRLPGETAANGPGPQPATPPGLSVEIRRFRHDVNNHLSVVLMAAGLLGMMPACAAGKERKWLEAITRRGQRIQELTDELFKLARGQVNGSSGMKRPVDLPKVVSETAAMFQSHPSGHRFSVIVIEPIPAVPGDEERLRRVVENLVGNAVKYSPAGSLIELVVLPHADRSADILVYDEGSGVPVEYREVIFAGERQPCHANLPGSGIGLAFCRQVVEEHGGRIWVEENSPRGSVFIVRLPVNETARIGSSPFAGKEEKMAA